MIVSGFEFDGIASLNATQFPPIAMHLPKMHRKKCDALFSVKMSE